MKHRRLQKAGEVARTTHGKYTESVNGRSIGKYLHVRTTSRWRDNIKAVHKGVSNTTFNSSPS
jgi:hypothetical protein